MGFLTPLQNIYELLYADVEKVYNSKNCLRTKLLK